MHNRTLSMIAAFLICFAMVAPANAEEGSRFDKLMQGPGTAKTIRSLGLAMLWLPHQPRDVEFQISPYWWHNNPGLKIDKVQRDLQIATMRRQLESAKRVVTKHGLKRLEVAGFNIIGSHRCIDMYYAGHSEHGPCMFRVSIVFGEDAQPWIHGIKSYNGFDEVRAAVEKIEHGPKDQVMSVVLPEKEQEPQEPKNDA